MDTNVRIVASVLLFADFILSGGLWTLGISKFSLVKREINPILKRLIPPNFMDEEGRWLLTGRLLWLGYWALWGSLLWLLPGQAGVTLAGIVIAISLLGLLSMAAR